MNAILDVFSSPEWRHLTLALLHTLWQGFVAAVLLGIGLKCISVNRPRARYAAGFAALFGVFFAGLVTWTILVRPESPAAPSLVPTLRVGTPPPQCSALPSVGPSSVVPHTGEEQPTLPSTLAQPDAGTRSPWFAAATAAWLTGVAIMLLRMLWTVLGLRRIAAGPELTDPVVRGVVEELRGRLRLRRMIRIVETARSFGPAVLGIVRPVLILPTSMATGLPPEALRAILAHELAHIRRHDYLLNLVQMAVESLLFFNPAVWWINRRIRAEREACCDAMAAELLGESSTLAESLAIWAERLRGVSPMPSPAAAWTERRPRLLLDRIRRMSVPGYRPPLPVSPLGFCGFVLLTCVVLCGLWRGTATAVEVVAKMLTPQERAEKVEKAKKEYCKPADEREVTFKVKVTTYDHRPLAGDISVESVMSRGGVQWSQHHNMRAAETIVFQTQAGNVTHVICADNYAPATLGPMTTKPGAVIDNLSVVLEKEKKYDIVFRVVNEQKEPIKNATIFYNTKRGGMQSSGTMNTDNKGVCILGDNGEYLRTFNVSRPGYQPLSDQKADSFRPKREVTVTLKRSKPIRGIVLSPRGQPVAGAAVDIFFRQYSSTTSSQSKFDAVGRRSHADAKTDALGRFVLDELQDGETVDVTVIAENHGWQIARGLWAKDSDWIIRLEPELVVSGEIRGDIAKVGEKRENRSYRNGHWNVDFSQTEPISHEDEKSCWRVFPTVPIEIRDGVGRFRITGLLPGDVYVAFGAYQTRVSVSAKSPHAKVSFDFTKPPARLNLKRLVRFHFTTSDGGVPAGTFNVSAHPSTDLSIKNGEASIEVDSNQSLYYYPKGLVNYWFADGSVRLDAGEKPVDVSIRLIPAGAIAGQVLNLDGSPRINCRVLLEAVSRKSTGAAPHHEIGEFDWSASGKLFFGPIPLGETYRIVANDGASVAVHDPIVLDGAKPTQTVVLRFPATRKITGKVFDPRGKPLSGVPVFLDINNFRLSKFCAIGNTTTNQRGEFAFDGLSQGLDVYSVSANPSSDYQTLEQAVPRNGDSLTFRLQPGMILEGQIIDKISKRPMTGVAIMAMHDDARAEIGSYLAGTNADKDGRFRFSTLQDRNYKLVVMGGIFNPVMEVVAQPGSKPVTIEVDRDLLRNE